MYYGILGLKYYYCSIHFCMNYGNIKFKNTRFQRTTQYLHFDRFNRVNDFLTKNGIVIKQKNWVISVFVLVRFLRGVRFSTQTNSNPC